MKRRCLVLAGVIMLACLAGILERSRPVGPGMTLSVNSAIRDTDVWIASARLPDGRAFSVPMVVQGMGKGNDNPLRDMAVMGATPDGRDLPEYVDFKWREVPVPEHPDPVPDDPNSAAHRAWLARWTAQMNALPMKSQRVFIGKRIPADVVRSVIGANRHTPKGQLDEASIWVHFIWTEFGIKVRWQVWHRLPSGFQYYSDDGGDEIVPAGKTMIAAYASIIKGDKPVVGLVGHPLERYPTTATGTFFPGSSSFAYTDKPLSGGESVAGFDGESELPEWVHLGWALFPAADLPAKKGEFDAERRSRTIKFLEALPRKDERILVRSRIPQDVLDEIAAATRNAQPHKVASSVIYLYFVWTDGGIKLHWRLKRSQPDGTFVSVREGGDEIRPAG